jgi:hypothetical protein
MKLWTQLATAACAALALAAASAPAQASTWLVNYVSDGGAPLAATLKLNVSNTVNGLGAFDVLSVLSGNVDGDLITGLTPNPNQPAIGTSPDGLFFFDNNFSPTTDPHFSNAGLMFMSLGAEYNLYSNGPGSYTLYKAQDRSYGANSNGKLTVASVPEPAVWALMIGGFGLAGAALRRRRAQLVPVRA